MLFSAKKQKTKHKINVCEEPDRRSLHLFHKPSSISIILVLQSLLLHTMFRFVNFRALCAAISGLTSISAHCSLNI